MSKGFDEVCGDLNLVALLHLAWVAAANGGLGNRGANVMAGAKLVLAYTGQWAHRMAHTNPAQRPRWVKAAQAAGLLVAPALHNEHHATYDDGFPILSGLTAPLIGAMNKAMPDRRLWLALFAIMSIGDVFVLERLMTAAFRAAGAAV